MESDLQLKLDTSLHSLAVVATAITFWETPQIKQKVQNYFAKIPKDQEFKKALFSREWFDIEMELNGNMRTLEVPTKIKLELYNLVEMIKEKIICWYEYVIVDLGLDSKFAGKIFWTSQAGIDEAKIFREFWQNEPDFHSSKHNINGLGSSLYMIACLYNQKDFVESKFEQMTNLTNTFFKLENESYSVSRIITIWLKFFFDVVVTSNDLLYRASLISGSNIAYKSSLNRFGDVPQSYLVHASAECLVNISKNNASSYKKEKYIDIFLFLLNKMSKEVKMQYLLSDHILKMFYSFLQVWPYQTFLLQILNSIRINSNVLDEVYPSLLNVIIKAEKERNGLTPRLYGEIDCNIFMEVFKMMPETLKREVLLKDEYGFCVYFFQSSNYSILRFLLNDAELSDLRNVVISKGHDTFKMYVAKCMFKDINSIIKDLTLTETEIRNFKIKYNYLSDIDLMSHYVECGGINYIDEHLNWLSYSECERMNLKNGINSAKICLKIFQHEYKIRYIKDNKPIFHFIYLDKYLNWQFDTQEDIVDFKLKLDLIDVYRTLIKKECEFKSFNGAFIYELLDWQFGLNEEKIKETKFKIGSDDFICEQICLLWHLNFVPGGEDSRRECSKFLMWFFESDEAILNQREKIIGIESFIKAFCDHLKNKKKEMRTETTESFLTYCNVTGDKMNEVKQAMINYLES